MKKYILEIGILILFLDQALKQLIMFHFSYQKFYSVIPNFFYLTYVKNTGGAWSILSNYSWLLLIVGFFCIAILFYYLHQKERFTLIEVIYSGLLIGGVLGNLIDRLIYHGVIDYIGFIFGNYYFPVFNLADISIVCGIGLFILDSLRGDKNGITGNRR